MNGFCSYILPRSVPAVISAATGAVLLATAAQAHEARSGWTYPYACCSDRDCREIPQSAVLERPEGYVLRRTGEVVAYSDRRVRQSPDGVFHLCTVAGLETSRTICLFVPPRMF